jgi:hypothetical protein
MGNTNSKNMNGFSDFEHCNENGFYIHTKDTFKCCCETSNSVIDDIEITENKVDTIDLPLETDSVVRSVLHKFIERSSFGKKKYGTDLDRDDLSMLDWIQHTQEELMDATLYLEKLKKTILEKMKNIEN